MTPVSVYAFAHGDGWLSVDTQSWIEDRGEYSPELTMDLRARMEQHGHRHPHDAVLVDWISARTGKGPSELHGDGVLWAHALFNTGDHVLDDEFGFVVLSAAGFGDLMITVSDAVGTYVAPTVYYSMVSELEEWADYSNAEGACARGHRWCTHDTVHLHAEDAAEMRTHRIADRVRVPFGDRSRAYVACPTCAKAVRFICRF